MSLYSFSDIHIGNTKMTDDLFLIKNLNTLQKLNYEAIMENPKNEIILNGDIFEVEANDKAYNCMSDSLRKEIIDEDYQIPFGDYLHNKILNSKDTDNNSKNLDNNSKNLNNKDTDNNKNIHYIMGNHDDVKGEYQTEQLILNKGKYRIVAEHGDMADNNKYVLDTTKCFGTSIRRCLAGCFGFCCQGSLEGKLQHHLDTSDFDFEYLYKTRIDDGKATLLCLLYAIKSWLDSPYDLMLMGHTHDLLIVKITHKPSGEKFIYANSGSGNWFAHTYNNSVNLPGYKASTKDLTSTVCAQGLRVDYDETSLKVTAIHSEYEIEKDSLEIKVNHNELGSLSLD
jgi:UDP-2,3-diacylglucosamine pyrophosphatase LpxH